MIKPKLIAQTKYFIALVSKDKTVSNPSKTTIVLIDQAWVGLRFISYDTDSHSLEMLIKHSYPSNDSDSMKFFNTIEEAYQFIKSEDFIKVMERSKLSLGKYEWHIMNSTTYINAVATESENNLDEAIADKALKDLQGKMTPEQLAILKKSL